MSTTVQPQIKLSGAFSPATVMQRVGGVFVEVYGAAPLFLDTFTDDDDTPIESHAPDVDTEADGWTANSGTLVTSGDRLVATGSSPGATGWIATFEAGAADGTFEVPLRADTGATGVPGVVCRYQDVSNFLHIFISPVADLVTFRRRTAGSYNGGTGAAADLSPDTDHVLRVVLDGDQVSIYVDDVQVFAPFTETQGQALTRHGIRLAQASLNSAADVSFTP